MVDVKKHLKGKESVNKIVGKFTDGTAKTPEKIIGNVSSKVPKGEPIIEAGKKVLKN